MKNETIVVKIEEVEKDNGRLLKEYLHHHVALRCRVCRKVLFVGIGKYKNDDFKLVVTYPNNHLQDIYEYRCPHCNSVELIRCFHLQTFHL